MNITISKNIRLELTSARHADLLFDVIDNNREHLLVFLPWVRDMKSSDDLKAYLINCELLYQQKMEVSFVIFFDGLPVGRIGLHHLNIQNKTGAIGYWLSKSAQGKGIMLTACNWLIHYGFHELGLHRIEIKAAVKNSRSQAIPQKLNFRKEGILRQAELVNDEFVDLVLYSVLSSEWKSNELVF